MPDDGIPHGIDDDPNGDAEKGATKGAPGRKTSGRPPQESSKDEEPEKAGPASKHAPPPEGGPTPKPVFFTLRGNTRVGILHTEEPWTLPVEALVIPAGPGTNLTGGLAQAWFDSGRNDAAAFRSALQAAQGQRGENAPLEPASPLLVPLPSMAGPLRYVILATAFAPQPEVSAAQTAAAAVVRLAAQNSLPRIAIALLGSGRGGLDSAEVAEAMLRGVVEALPAPPVEEITLTTLSQKAAAAGQSLLSRLVAALSPGLANDLVQGEDLLDIADEVYALADGLMLREMSPPLVVGVLGGWGSGKSFVMDLMHRRMAEIRSMPLPDAAPDAPKAPDFPYVGHAYLIKFDAWTYAKSNLWASLMQKVFYDLNRQLTLEKCLREANLDQRVGEQIWKLLYDLPEREREELLGNPEVLKAFRKSEATEVTTDLLWSTLRDVKQREHEALRTIEEELANKRKELDAAQEALTRAVDDEIARAARRAAWKPLEKLLRDLLGETYGSFLQQVNPAAQPFRVDDFRDPAALAKKLHAHSDPVSEYIWGQFKSDEQRALNPPPAQPEVFVRAFKRLLEDEDLYESQRFSKVELSPDTRELIELLQQKGGKAVLSGRNRLLLEDAYPQEIAKSARGEDLRLQEIRPNFHSLIEIGRRSWLELAAFLLFFAATLGLPLALKQLEAYQFPGSVLALGSLIVAASRSMEKWRRLLADSRASYEKQVQEERERLVAERPRRLQQKREAPAAEGAAGLPALEMEVQKLEAQAKRQRQQVGLTADSLSLADFVTSRLNAAFYENQLGLMHQVQRDLAELAGGLSDRKELPNAEPRGDTADAAPQDSAAAEATREKLFPRGPARIVLFIDDLDRCPPATVVQVLEATQLLVKTPLFVVVLAMDVRFITRALEKSYASILTRRGKPSGLDYIEKIIQIPYQVRPINPDGLSRYLNAQMPRPPRRVAPAETAQQPHRADEGRPPQPPREEPERLPAPPASTKPPEAILPTSVLQFSEAEYAFMEECCRHIDLTPRAVKRLVNVYKLLKIIWFRPSRRRPDPEVEKAIVLLLALSGRYPDLMRDVLESIKEERENNLRFVELFREYKPVLQDAYTQREWRRLLDDMNTLMSSSNLTLKQMDTSDFDLIHSFSFVGDIGYEPSDFVTPAPQDEDP